MVSGTQRCGAGRDKACTEYGVLWLPSTHAVFAMRKRAVIRTLLVIARARTRGGGPESCNYAYESAALVVLPTELLDEVFRFVVASPWR